MVELPAKKKSRAKGRPLHVFLSQDLPNTFLSAPRNEVILSHLFTKQQTPDASNCLASMSIGERPKQPPQQGSLALWHSICDAGKGTLYGLTRNLSKKVVSSSGRLAVKAS